MTSASGTFQTVGLRLVGGAAVRQPAPAQQQAAAAPATAFSRPPPLKVPKQLLTLWLASVAGFAFLTACAEVFGGR